MILIDTSAWIEYFRATGSSAALEVRRLLAEQTDQIAICEPIAMEILSGAIDDAAHAQLERLVNGLPSLDVNVALDFRTAAQIYRAARRAGRTIRSINDCLIAAVAIRHNAHVVHRGADFDVIVAMTCLVATSLR
ncbi:type II toxin-antitoxin system VapC family toxin [Mycobacterium bourgelatii]|uniref:Ribonuclease VapC n=1 Tax=Mycobacterium bourgelatii TaxID=1273442 RepID=A0A7I9YQI7_MYCBU|nr:PIN domain nuclease [Mycobacterium bourgelatii]MCV6973982.1 PIN domain nuclease [Mycobacterium bourgelatii]GFG90940.1 ribonuclease VapC11 [Mycobacterium bourgelatii]